MAPVTRSQTRRGAAAPPPPPLAVRSPFQILPLEIIFMIGDFLPRNQRPNNPKIVHPELVIKFEYVRANKDHIDANGRIQRSRRAHVKSIISMRPERRKHAWLNLCSRYRQVYLDANRDNLTLGPTDSCRYFKHDRDRVWLRYADLFGLGIGNGYLNRFAAWGVQPLNSFTLVTQNNLSDDRPDVEALVTQNVPPQRPDVNWQQIIRIRTHLYPSLPAICRYGVQDLMNENLQPLLGIGRKSQIQASPRNWDPTGLDTTIRGIFNEFLRMRKTLNRRQKQITDVEAEIVFEAFADFWDWNPDLLSDYESDSDDSVPPNDPKDTRRTRRRKERKRVWPQGVDFDEYPVDYEPMDDWPQWNQLHAAEQAEVQRELDEAQAAEDAKSKAKSTKRAKRKRSDSTKEESDDEGEGAKSTKKAKKKEKRLTEAVKAKKKAKKEAMEGAMEGAMEEVMMNTATYSMGTWTAKTNVEMHIAMMTHNALTILIRRSMSIVAAHILSMTM